MILLNIDTKIKVGRVAQVVEHLPSKCEAQIQTLVLQKKKEIDSKTGTYVHINMDIFHSLNYLEGLERITVKNEVWFANILSFKNMLVFFFFWWFWG
jgi:hypothetical protein